MSLELSEILQWDLGQLYNYVQMIEDELEESEIKSLKEAELGKLGYPVHIKYYINNYYNEYPSSKKAKIQGFGKISLEGFWKDLDNRAKKLRIIISNHLETESPTEGRT